MNVTLKRKKIGEQREYTLTTVFVKPWYFQSPVNLVTPILPFAVKSIRRYKKNNPPIRYAKLVPGERDQPAGAVDVCKIKAGLYQYTAVDD